MARQLDPWIQTLFAVAICTRRGGATSSCADCGCFADGASHLKIRHVCLLVAQKSRGHHRCDEPRHHGYESIKSCNAFATAAAGRLPHCIGCCLGRREIWQLAYNEVMAREAHGGRSDPPARIRPGSKMYRGLITATSTISSVWSNSIRSRAKRRYLYSLHRTVSSRHLTEQKASVLLGCKDPFCTRAVEQFRSKCL